MGEGPRRMVDQDEYAEIVEENHRLRSKLDSTGQERDRLTAEVKRLHRLLAAKEALQDETVPYHAVEFDDVSPLGSRAIEYLRSWSKDRGQHDKVRNTFGTNWFYAAQLVIAYHDAGEAITAEVERLRKSVDFTAKCAREGVATKSELAKLLEDTLEAPAEQPAAIPMLRIPIIPGDPEADARMDELMRRKNALRDMQPLEDAPAQRESGRERLHGRTIDEWHAELVRLTDAVYEALNAPGWPDWEQVLREAVEGKARPDYVPAVRRVVRLDGGRGARVCVGKAYLDAAWSLIVRSCARLGRLPWVEYHQFWPYERLQRLADVLQRRDEEAWSR